MKRAGKRLFALPDMAVGHYTSHADADYYRQALQAVAQKTDIPAGIYACEAMRYRCPKCGKSLTKLSIYLPVRDQKKREEDILFENGQLDDFLWD